jgi:hypothetical protein
MSADKDKHAAPTEPSAFIFISYKHMVPPGPRHFLPQQQIITPLPLFAQT